MTDSADEIWLPVVGFEGRYEVSNHGRVWSLIAQPPRLLTLLFEEDGYLTIGLYDGKRQTNHKVHRLVARAFMGEKENVLHREVAHLDGSRTNNRADNLKWVSHAENMFHKFRHGTHHRGERHPRSRLTDAQVSDMIAEIADGLPLYEAARKFGVSYGTVEGIKRGRSWRHIPRPHFMRAHGQAGERNHNAKFSKAEVEEIRRRRRGGESCQSLADHYGVWKGTISRIARFEAYRG